MKTIKFRVWCFDNYEGNSLMYFPADFQELYQLTTNGQQHEEFVIQQFTGLLDKNNKEIYEGDLLKCNAECGVGLNGKTPVQFDDVSCEFGAGEKYFCGFGLMLGRAAIGYKQKIHDATGIYPEQSIKEILKEVVEYMGLEIVGNIFENPELIRVDKLK